MSVTLQAPFAGSWQQFIGVERGSYGQPQSGRPAIASHNARALPKAAAASAASNRRRATWSKIMPCSRYTICGKPFTGSELAARHGPEIAQLLRCERAPLSEAETAEVMAGSLSYQPDDCWWCAGMLRSLFDAPSAMEATSEVLEFTNSQLLEFHCYGSSSGRRGSQRFTTRCKVGVRPHACSVPTVTARLPGG